MPHNFCYYEVAICNLRVILTNFVEEAILLALLRSSCSCGINEWMHNPEEGVVPEEDKGKYKLEEFISLGKAR